MDCPRDFCGPQRFRTSASVGAKVWWEVSLPELEAPPGRRSSSANAYTQTDSGHSSGLRSSDRAPSRQTWGSQWSRRVRMRPSAALPISPSADPVSFENALAALAPARLDRLESPGPAPELLRELIWCRRPDLSRPTVDKTTRAGPRQIRRASRRRYPVPPPLPPSSLPSTC